jgi:hypothetical protein
MTRFNITLDATTRANLDELATRRKQAALIRNLINNEYARLVALGAVIAKVDAEYRANGLKEA